MRKEMRTNFHFNVLTREQNSESLGKLRTSGDFSHSEKPSKDTKSGNFLSFASRSNTLNPHKQN